MSKSEPAVKDPLRHADLFGDDDDTDDLNSMFGKTAVKTTTKANLFGGDDEDLFGAGFKNQEIVERKTEGKTETLGEEAEASIEDNVAAAATAAVDHSDYLFQEAPKSVDESLVLDGVEGEKKSAKSDLFDDLDQADNVLASLQATKEQRDLGGLFLPKEAVEKRGDSERQRHDSVDKDLLHIDGDETLEKFADKPKKALATATATADTDDLFAGGGAASSVGNLDDDLFAMAGGGSTGGAGVGDGFDFAAYINSNSGGGGTSGKLFDD